jgi:hypothetical protein
MVWFGRRRKLGQWNARQVFPFVQKRVVLADSIRAESVGLDRDFVAQAFQT